MTTTPTPAFDPIRTAFDVGRSGAPTIPAPDGSLVALVPKDTQQITLPPHEPILTRVRQKVTVHDRDSFVAYVTRYKTQRTRLFAEPGFLAQGGAHVSAVVDYHGSDGPDHCAHSVVYRPRYSDQWQRWHKACAQPLKQAEFAELIEELRSDIREPEAAKLLDIVRAFKASKRVEFDSVVYQPGGDVTLAYDEKTQQQGKSGPLPEKLTLGIPVYFRGTVYAVPVWVRFRVGNGAVQFQLKMDRADVIEDVAFGEISQAVSAATGIEAYLGRMG